MPRRWAMLAESARWRSAAAVMIHGPAFLDPGPAQPRGHEPRHAGLVAAAAPTVGVMLTLVAGAWSPTAAGSGSCCWSALSPPSLAGAPAP